MNNISDILYNITIYPFEIIIKSLYIMFEKIGLGYTLIIMGILINIIALPLYNIADSLQKRESDLHKKFKPKIDEIRAVFSGDKRQMIIQTFYKINNYHPIYSLRGVLGLMIQIPIFIAAYKVITSIDSNSRFLFISDLSKPDALINIGPLTINFLPILMTSINIIASLIHTRELSNKERVPLFIMAGLFLVLLYNSPAALLVYWTTTNLFSLVKNLILIKPNILPKFFIKTKIFWIVLSIAWLLSPLVFILQLAVPGKDAYKVIIPGIILIIIIYTYIITSSDKISKNYKSDTKIFLISIIFMSILFGLYIPSSLISSSPKEFEKPISLIINTFSKSIGMFITYIVLLYFSSSEKIKKMFTTVFTFIFLISLIDTFVFSGNYGTLSGNLFFVNKDMLIPNNIETLLNIFAIILIIIFMWRKLFYKNIFKTISIISIIILCVISSFDLYSINKIIGTPDNNDAKTKNKVSKIIDLSKDGKNVFVFFFDAAVSSHIQTILETMPEIKKELDGFTYYPNTISFGTHTVSAISAIFGGYEYTSLEMNKRENETLKDKHHEAILLLPKIFIGNNYSATVIYPTMAGWVWEPDITAFKKYSDINMYSRPFSVSKNDENYKSKTSFDDIILDFSLFKISPMFFRYSIYDDGNWVLNDYKYVPIEITEYNYVKELTNMINIVSNTNTYTYFGSDLVHDFTHFNNNYFPEMDKNEVPKEDINKYGSEKEARRVYANIRMLLEIINFSKFLKENNMYDNTKIIIVSDHGDIGLGSQVFTGYENKFSKVAEEEIQGLHSTLLVKDFNSKGTIRISTNFMTIADTPIVATSHLSNVINPFTKKELKPNKENGVYPAITRYAIYLQNKNTFNIKSILYVSNGNIFDMKNWSEISNFQTK